MTEMPAAAAAAQASKDCTSDKKGAKVTSNKSMELRLSRAQVIVEGKTGGLRNLKEQERQCRPTDVSGQDHFLVT